VGLLFLFTFSGMENINTLALLAATTGAAMNMVSHPPRNVRFASAVCALLRQNIGESLGLGRKLAGSAFQFHFKLAIVKIAFHFTDARVRDKEEVLLRNSKATTTTTEDQ